MSKTREEYKSMFNVFYTGEDYYEMVRPAVYLWFRSSRCLYIGQAMRSLERLTGEHHVINKREFVQPQDRFYLIFCPEHELSTLERELIAEYKPKYNIAHNTNNYDRYTAKQRGDARERAGVMLTLCDADPTTMNAKQLGKHIAHIRSLKAAIDVIDP